MRKGWGWALLAASVSIAFAASWASSFKSRHAETHRAVAVVEVGRAPAAQRRPAPMRTGGNGVVERNGSPPRLPPVTLRLNGQIDGTGGVAQTVTVRVGSLTVPATASGYNFVADLTFVNPASMVSVELSAPPNIRYRALLGTAGLLKAQAGADRALDPSENPSARVSPVSTAIDFFVRRELGGRLPVDDIEMDNAVRALFAADIAPAAHLMHLIRGGAVPLPIGYADSLAVLEDRARYRQLLNQYPAIRSGADDYLRNTQVGEFSPADLDRSWLLTARIGRDGAPFVQPTVQMMTRRPSGGFSVATLHSRTDPNFDAALVFGQLRIEPQGQPYLEDLVFDSSVEPNPNLQPIVQRSRIVRETYRRLFVGRRQQLWLQIRDMVRSYPQYPSQPQTIAGSTTVLNASPFEAAIAPMRDTDLLGRRAMPHFCLQPSRVAGEADVLQNCEFALHAVGTNGAIQIDGLGQKVDAALNPVSPSGSAGAQWRLDADGSAVVDTAAVSTRYWRLGLGDAASDAMVFLATAQSDGQTQYLAGHTIVINGNQPVFFGATDPVGAWAYGTFEGNPEEYGYRDGDPLSGVRFVRDANGQQDQLSPFSQTPTSPAYTLLQRSGWVLNGSNLYDTRYRANIPTPSGTQFFYSCASAFAQGATQCAPIRVRYFRPLARVGNRWYGIEDLYIRSSTASYTPPFQFERSSRANYYERL